MKKMNSLERFYQTLRCQATDRRCALPLVFGFAAHTSGVKLKDYLSDAEALAYAQLQAQQEFGYDAVYIYGGNAVEVESIGVPVVFPEGDYPYVDPQYQPEPLAALLDKLDKLDTDLTGRGRIPQLVKAVSRLRQQVDGQLPVVGVVAGPFTIAIQILGLEKMLFSLIDEPLQAARFLQQVSLLSQRHALALIKAGAQVIMLLDPASSQTILTPSVFKKFSLPLLKNIFKDCRAAGALACWLAITGKTDDFLLSYPSAGVDLATLDYEVSMEKAIHLLPQMVIAGNLCPFDFVERQPWELKEQCLELLELVATRPGFILSTGCEVPLNSKPENLRAMMDVL